MNERIEGVGQLNVCHAESMRRTLEPNIPGVWRYHNFQSGSLFVVLACRISSSTQPYVPTASVYPSNAIYFCWNSVCFPRWRALKCSASAGRIRWKQSITCMNNTECPKQLTHTRTCVRERRGKQADRPMYGNVIVTVKNCRMTSFKTIWLMIN